MFFSTLKFLTLFDDCKIIKEGDNLKEVIAKILEYFLIFLGVLLLGLCIFTDYLLEQMKEW
jgi:hypothetical protein